jgi:hypothetical protein
VHVTGYCAWRDIRGVVVTDVEHIMTFVFMSARCPANASRTPPMPVHSAMDCTARKELHRCGCRIKLDDAIKCPTSLGTEEPGIYVRQEVVTSGVLSTAERRHGTEVAEDRIE